MDAMSAPALELCSIFRRFADASRSAVDGVDLSVATGEFVALLGPSGSGKTTLLRLIAGFERPDRGVVRLNGRHADGPPETRGLGMVFQGLALWPHLDVGGNVGYPLAVRGLRRRDRAAPVEAALAAVGLAGFAGRRPASLSGGQRQRVAIARVLAMAPKLVLLDEPLASLDPALKAEIMEQIAALRARTGAAMLYVTHDQNEAMALADRIAVMQDGRIVQVAPPEILYREPATAFIAGFVGRGRLLPVEVLEVETGVARVRLGREHFVARASAGQRPGPAQLCVRPEMVHAGGRLSGVLGDGVYAGGHWRTSFALDDLPQPPLELDLSSRPLAGERIAITIAEAWVVPEAPVAPRASRTTTMAGS